MLVLNSIPSILGVYEERAVFQPFRVKGIFVISFYQYGLRLRLSHLFRNHDLGLLLVERSTLRMECRSFEDHKQP